MKKSKISTTLKTDRKKILRDAVLQELNNNEPLIASQVINKQATSNQPVIKKSLYPKTDSLKPPAIKIQSIKNNSAIDLENKKTNQIINMPTKKITPPKDKKVVKVEKKPKTTKKKVAKKTKKIPSSINRPKYSPKEMESLTLNDIFGTNESSVIKNTTGEKSNQSKRAIQKGFFRASQKPLEFVTDESQEGGKTENKNLDLRSLFNSASINKSKNKISSVGGNNSVDKGGKWARLMIKIVVGLLILIILSVGACMVGLYRFNFNHDLAITMAKTLQLPAGKINNQYISLGDYLDNIKKMSSAIAQKREGIYLYSDSTQLADQILYRLAAEKIMEAELSKRGVDFDDSLVKTQMNSLIQQAGGEESAIKMVSDLYGLNLNDFKDKILRPLTLRDQFQSIIMQDESIGINQTAKQKADQVLSLALSSSSDFSVLAKEYTNDESGINTGGDLGWVIKEQIKEDWRDLIFNQADETVIPQLLKSVYGYHIVKVEKKLTDEASGTESVKLRHILIGVNIDDYIKELLDASTLVKYTK